MRVYLPPHAIVHAHTHTHARDSMCLVSERARARTNINGVEIARSFSSAQWRDDDASPAAASAHQHSRIISVICQPQTQQTPQTFPYIHSGTFIICCRCFGCRRGVLRTRTHARTIAPRITRRPVNVIKITRSHARAGAGAHKDDVRSCTHTRPLAILYI